MLTLASAQKSLHPVAGVVDQRNLRVVFPRRLRLFGTNAPVSLSNGRAFVKKRHLSGVGQFGPVAAILHRKMAA
jgi:hypothetical protein